jgi:hypothetical protein
VHPIVPIIMAFGAILFLVGIIVQVRFGAKRIKIIKLRGKEYKLWQFVVTTIGSGVALIIVSVLVPKYLPYQPESTAQTVQPAISGNLKYELDSILSSLKINNGPLMDAISRFQSEYPEALKRGDKNVTDLLVLEMAFRIRTELQNLDYPDSQIEREVERIIGILKQPAQQGR